MLERWRDQTRDCLVILSYFYPSNTLPMTLGPQLGDTRIATLERMHPTLLEVRFKQGAVFTREDVTEVQEMRRKIMGEQQYVTLNIIPEDSDFTLDSMRTDHMEQDRSMGKLRATAIVVNSSMMERLTHVYFKFFPHMKNLLVTDNEQEARTWLDSQLEEIAKPGS